MTDLHIAQISIDMPTLLRFYGRMFDTGSPATSDERFLIKTAFTEIFPDCSPRPWRIQRFAAGGETVILGYTTADKDRLRSLARRVAIPELAGVVDPEAIFTRPAPQLSEGESFEAQVMLCPTIRPTKDGKRREVDAHIVALEAAKAADAPMPTRDETYGALLSSYLGGAALTGRATLHGWRLVRCARKGSDGKVGEKPVTIPIADLSIPVTIRDPAAFASLLVGGVGRARAYGCGMVLLRPM